MFAYAKMLVRIEHLIFRTTPYLGSIYVSVFRIYLDGVEDNMNGFAENYSYMQKAQKLFNRPSVASFFHLK